MNPEKHDLDRGQHVGSKYMKLTTLGQDSGPIIQTRYSTDLETTF